MNCSSPCGSRTTASSRSSTSRVSPARAVSGYRETFAAEGAAREHRRFQSRDRLQKLRLARRAFPQFFDFFVVDLAPGLDEQLLFPSDFRAPDHLRQQTAHYCFDRAAVIGADPFRQLEQLLRSRSAPRPTIASIGRMPFASLCSRVATTVASADLSRNGTRTREPTADSLRQALGHEIIELAMDRPINDDANVAGFRHA